MKRRYFLGQDWLHDLGCCNVTVKNERVKPQAKKKKKESDQKKLSYNQILLFIGAEAF